MKRLSRSKKISICLWIAPFLIALPLNYWVFHFCRMPSWVEYPERHLAEEFLFLMACVIVVCWWSALAFLFLDDCYARLTGCVAVATLPLMVIAACFLLSIPYSYVMNHLLK
jgi:hypothetical protein